MDTQTPQPKHPSHRVVELFVAACSGSGRLSGQVGRPVLLIDAALDAGMAVQDLNRRRLGAGVLWPHSFQPLDCESGWDDWRLLDLDLGPDAPLPFGDGARIVDGRMRVRIAAATSVSEVREQMSGTLRHLRVQDAVRRPEWLEERSDLMADVVVHPRYELPNYPDFRGAQLVESLYVVDPVDGLMRLVWLAAAAILADLHAVRH